MEIRWLTKTVHYVKFPEGVFGAKGQKATKTIKTLQYKNNDEDGWLNVPFVTEPPEKDNGQ